jgi:hypothetical protein
VKIIVKAKEDESIGLRLEIDALTAKLEASKAPAILVKKRKKADADVIPYPRSPKRVKHDTPMGISTILKLDESTESALGEGGDIGVLLIVGGINCIKSLTMQATHFSEPFITSMLRSRAMPRSILPRCCIISSMQHHT